MATIPNQATGLRHVRKTITFDGSANNGNLGDEIPVFATTGAVYVSLVSAYISSSLVCSAPSQTGLYVGPSPTTSGYAADWGNPTALNGSTGDGSAGQWVSVPTFGIITYPSFTSMPVGYDDVVFKVVNLGTGADITGGTIIVDAWYYAVTDDGALAGDDIDTELVAAVNAQVVDALATDTYAEPGSVPAATSSLKDKINWLFALARNKVTQTSTTQTLRNDADSGNIATSSVSDDGSTFTRGEWS